MWTGRSRGTAPARYDAAKKQMCRVKVTFDINFGKYAYEHVLSFQRRVRKNKETSLP